MPPHKPKPQIPLTHPGGLQVICLGLPRCATSTLKLMLEETLAIGPCMHMSRCLPDPSKMALVEQALHEPDASRRRGLLVQLFAGAAATADFPGHLFVEDLVVMYPDAKFVLNVRSPPAGGHGGHGGSGGGPSRAWSESMREAIAPFLSTRYRVACWWSRPDWQHYQAEMAWEAFVHQKLGVHGICDEEVYERHNEWVRQTVRAAGKELLEWEPGMGHEPLCAFLGVPPPGGEIPKLNERGQMKKVMAWRISIGLKLWLRKVVLPTAVVGVALVYSSTRSMPLLTLGWLNVVSP